MTVQPSTGVRFDPMAAGATDGSTGAVDPCEAAGFDPAALGGEGDIDAEGELVARDGWSEGDRSDVGGEWTATPSRTTGDAADSMSHDTSFCERSSGTDSERARRSISATRRGDPTTAESDVTTAGDGGPGGRGR